MIDNFSRKIMSWQLADTLSPATTCEVLGLDQPVTVVADSGGENINGKVDELLDGGVLKRVLAQVDVNFSNSMVEAFWRSLRHQWLYLNTLDDITALRGLIGFYVDQHNGSMPHSAFDGATPDEVYAGHANTVIGTLATARAKARQERLNANRQAACPACRPPPGAENSGDSGGVAVASS